MHTNGGIQKVGAEPATRSAVATCKINKNKIKIKKKGRVISSVPRQLQCLDYTTGLHNGAT